MFAPGVEDLAAALPLGVAASLLPVVMLPALRVERLPAAVLVPARLAVICDLGVALPEPARLAVAADRPLFELSPARATEERPTLPFGFPAG